MEAALPEQSTEELFSKVKWVFRVFAALWRQKYCGDVTFHFHMGNLSQEYHRQVKERAPE